MAFSFDSRIRYSEVDSSCRLSLTGLTNYFQDCSVFHSQSHDVGIRFLADNHIGIWYEGVLRLQKFHT